jgi:predicted nuclease of predicted toxin-antitoxin system
MRFIVDAQLPPALAAWLGARGHEAVHVFERFPPSVADSVIWQHASETGTIIVSKDQDFVMRSLATQTGPVFLWLRIGNTTKTALLERLGSHWPAIEAALYRGERLIEVS